MPTALSGEDVGIAKPLSDEEVGLAKPLSDAEVGLDDAYKRSQAMAHPELREPRRGMGGGVARAQVDTPDDLTQAFEQVRQQEVAEGKSPPRTLKEWFMAAGPHFQKNEVSKDDPIVQATGKEIYNQVVSVPEFALQPVGLAAASVSALNPAVGRLIAAGFSVDMAKSAYDQAQTLWKNRSAMTPAQWAKGLVDLGSTGVMGWLTGKHAAAGPKDVVAADQRAGQIQPEALGTEPVSPRSITLDGTGAPAFTPPVSVALAGAGIVTQPQLADIPFGQQQAGTGRGLKLPPGVKASDLLARAAEVAQEPPKTPQEAPPAPLQPTEAIPASVSGSESGLAKQEYEMFVKAGFPKSTALEAARKRDPNFTPEQPAGPPRVTGEGQARALTPVAAEAGMANEGAASTAPSQPAVAEPTPAAGEAQGGVRPEEVPPLPESARGRLQRKVRKVLGKPADAGKAAAAKGQALADNPYVENTAEYSAWEAGWNSAQSPAAVAPEPPSPKSKDSDPARAAIGKPSGEPPKAGAGADLFPDLKGKAPTLERVRRAIVEAEKAYDQTATDAQKPDVPLDSPLYDRADLAQRRLERLRALGSKLEQQALAAAKPKGPLPLSEFEQATLGRLNLKYDQRRPMTVAERNQRRALKDRQEAQPPAEPPKPAEAGPGIGQGPGGRTATASAKPEPPESYEGTGLKNAVAELEAAGLGHDLPPTVRRKMAERWEEASDTLARDSTAGQRLAADLIANPERGMTDSESALLLRHKVDVANALNDAAERTVSGPADSRGQAKLEYARLSDEFKTLLDSIKQRGTEWGREGRWRQAMAYEDYTFAAQEKLLRAAKGGEPLTDGEREALLADIEAHKQNAVAQETLRKVAEDKAAELQAKLALEAIENENLRKNVPEFSPKVLEIAKKWVAKWDKEADDSMNFLMGKTWTPTPEMLKHIAIVARGNLAHAALSFTEWSVKMSEKLGEGVKPYLQAAWEAGQKMLEDEKGLAEPVRKAIKRNATGAEKQTDLAERIKSKLADKRLDEITPLVQKLAKSFSDQGVRGWRALNGAVHGVLKQLIPDLDYRETVQAVSGHGQFRIPDQTESAKALRDAKAQANEVLKIQEVIARQPVQPTGLRRDLPSDVKRRLTQIYENAKRQFGITFADPATQLRSALQARKTYYEHRLSDLQAEINARKRTVKTKAPSPTDLELEKLMAEYEQVKAAHKEVFGERQLTDAQRAERESKSLDRQIAEVERQLKEGDIFPDGQKSAKPSTPEIEAKRANLEALKAERGYLLEALNPATTPEQEHLKLVERTLAAIRAALTRKIAGRTGRMARGGFAPKVRRPPPVLDPATSRLKAEGARIEQRFEDRRRSAELSQRSKPQKAWDFFTKWMRREWVLSSPSSLVKLGSAAVQGLTFEPLKEAVGAGVATAFPRFAERLQTEARSSVGIEVRALTEAFTKSMADAYQTLKTGKSDLEVQFGGRRAVPEEMVSYFGRLHAATKTPLKRAAFTRVFAKLAKQEIMAGNDMTDPMVQMRVGNLAMKEANRMLFLEDNMVVNFYKRGLSALEEKDPATGKPRPLGTLGGGTMRLLLPIVRIPTNLVARTVQAAVGFPVGATKLALAYAKGIESLPKEQADLIMRQLKQGSIGGAFLVAGFLSPNVFGGYYQQGEKRDDNEPGVGKMKIGDYQVPALLQHHPLLQVLQLGSTIRRVMDSKLRNKDDEPQGFAAGAEAGALGLLEETPFVRETLDISKLHSRYERGAFQRRLGASIVVPQASQWAARELDKPTPFSIFQDPIRRKEETFGDSLRAGIPGLRETLPEK